MQRIAVAGLISPAQLGDTLQYYATIKLLNSLVPEADVTFLCPCLEENISVFRGLEPKSLLVDRQFYGGWLLKYLLRSLIPHKRASTVKGKAMAMVQVDKVNTVLKTIRIVGRRLCNSYRFSKYVGSSIMRLHSSFNAGIFGGHTVSTVSSPWSSPYHFIVQYEILRSMVRGPMLMSPISVSMLALEHFGQKTSTRRLKRSLQKFDFLYVRGPHSLGILRDRLNIDEERVAMALDSGFGMRLFHPDITAFKDLGKEVLRIVIIPREDYFSLYHRKDLRKSYLNALINLILWFFRNFDAEVYLTSQTIHLDQAMIDEVVRLLEKRSNGRYLKYLKINNPNNLINAYRLYSSADLVITSYMHGGVMALSAGVPAIFILPSADVKVLDILSFLGLDTSSYLIDMFDANALRTEHIINRIGSVIENLEHHRRTVESAVKQLLPTVELPIRTLIKLSK